MYTNPLTIQNYLYYVNRPSIPSISVNMNKDSIESVESAANDYLDLSSSSGDAVDYRNEVLRRVIHRDYVIDRFQKDLLGMSVTVQRDPSSFIGSLSKIDLVNNEYIPNEKSNEVYEEASRGNELYYDSGLTTTMDNYVRIFSTIMVKDDLSGLIYDDYELPEVYDSRAIVVQNEALSGHDLYVLSNDVSVDSEKTYYSRNGQIYSEVGDPEGSPKDQGLYELLENVVVFINEAPSAEAGKRVLNSFEYSFKITLDETAKDGKKYYSLDGSNYVDASVESGDVLNGTFYEIDLLPANSQRKYTLRHNGSSSDPHWYISTITDSGSSTTIGDEILKTSSIDSDEIIWQNL